MNVADIRRRRPLTRAECPAGSVIGSHGLLVARAGIARPETKTGRIEPMRPVKSLKGVSSYQTKNEPIVKMSFSASPAAKPAPGFAENSFSALLYSAISLSQEFTSW